MRKPAKAKRTDKGRVSEVYSQPAPIKGWVSSENIVGMDPESAYLLDNWFPETNSIILRPGFASHNTIPGGYGVVTLMVYQAGTIKQLFASAGNSIYDVSAIDQNPTPFFSNQVSSGMFLSPRIWRRRAKPSLYQINPRKGSLPF